MLAALAAVGCKEGDSKNAPASGRVNAVKGGSTAKAIDPSAFCDVETPDRPFAFPALDGAAPDAVAGRWRWVNVWATWCKPCVEELPRLAGWTKKLSGAGPAIDLVLISVDESRAAIAAFEAKHGAVGATTRLDDPDAATAWLVSMGLDEGAPLPVHILVAPSGTIRCLRSGAINDRDYDRVAALVNGAN